MHSLVLPDPGTSTSVPDYALYIHRSTIVLVDVALCWIVDLLCMAVQVRRTV